jgi:hypothetical protein
MARKALLTRCPWPLASRTLFADGRKARLGVGFEPTVELCLRQNNPTGKFSLSPSGKSLLGLPPSCPGGRGVGHRHRTLGWDAVDAAALGA